MAGTGGLPAGWVERESSSHPGRVYYFNLATQESVWDRPTTTAAAAEPRSVRASHILVKHAGSRRPSSWRCCRTARWGRSMP